MTWQALDKFHKTKVGFLTLGLVELLITYGFAGLAIDRGNLWWYLLALIFLIETLQNFFKLALNILGRSRG